MSDPRFELELQRLFAEAPSRPDAELFALRVADRLERSWTLRRLGVGLAGAAAGAVALWQLGGAQVLGRLDEAVQAPLSDWMRHAPVLADVGPVLRTLPIPGELVWVVGGLMLLALGLVVTRVVDEI